MTLLDYLTTLPGRCESCGAHLAAQGCRCGGDEWSIFTRALRAAADDTGHISQTRMRPLIQAIPHKHRGTLYRRATSLGLIRQDGWEPSTDAAGGNADKQQRRYVLVGAR
jgi:hypothetical protein